MTTPTSTAPTLTERSCGYCATTIQVTRRNPNRRFCSTRCRRAAHHARTTQHQSNAVRNDVTPFGAVANAVLNDVDHIPNLVPAVNGIQRCPHCRHELAVLAVVIPTDAAHVRLPEVTHFDP